MSTPRSSRVLRASEIGEYIFCQRAWWLHQVQGIASANRAQLEGGIARHRAHGIQVRRAGALRRAALVALAAALVLGVMTAVAILVSLT